jgi:hypothetical protein
LYRYSVAFQNGGDAAWLSAVILVRLAFPEHTIVLVQSPELLMGGPGALTSTLPILKHVRNARANELLPQFGGGGGGGGGEDAANSNNNTAAAAAAVVAVDLVVEGPAMHRDDPGGCSFGDAGTPWLQVSMEGHWNSYDGDGDGDAGAAAMACGHHASPPLVRLDATARGRVERRLEGTPTKYLWAPPLAAAAELYRTQLSNRRVAFLHPKPHDRPHLAAYLSHECKVGLYNCKYS